ncbi:DUF167 domain-containing protein [Candidatus Nanosynbacter lyticus]
MTLAAERVCWIDKIIMKISVHLKPNSRHREEVVPNDDGSLTIYTKAPAIEGRANLAAGKLLAKYFGVAPSRVKLARGASSKYKIFEID